MSTFRIFDIAGQAMSAQSIRLNTIASNMANANSVSGSEAETYRARHPVFSVYTLGESDDIENGAAAKGVRVDEIVEDTKPLEMKYDPSHPKADKNGYIYVSNVNIVQEMADMISASRSYETNVQMLNNAKELMQHTLNIGK
jgi:flagellar basal-body rod protein FlgC